MVTTRKHVEETGTGENKEHLQEKQQAKKQEEGPGSKKRKCAEWEGSQGGQGNKQKQEEGAAEGAMPEKDRVGGKDKEEKEEEEKEAVGEEKQLEPEEEATEGLQKKGTTATAKGKKVAEEMKKGKTNRCQTIKSRLGLEIGSPAPEFVLSNEEGETVALKDFKGKHVVIYFYNKDDTPVVTRGCTAFTKIFPEMEKRGISLLFIGPDSVESHKNFKEKAKLPFTLLSDSKKEVARAFHNLRGRNVVRTTVLIDPEGKIFNVFADIPEAEVDQNPAEALKFMKSMLVA